MRYEATIFIREDTFNRVNGLLAIPSIDEMTDKERSEAGVEKDYYENVFGVFFEDGSEFRFDLCSGSENYFDDAVWSKQSVTHGRDVVLDCSYDLPRIIEFEADGNTYIIYVELIDSAGVCCA